MPRGSTVPVDRSPERADVGAAGDTTRPAQPASRWADLQVGAMRVAARGLARLGSAHVWLVFRKDLQRPLPPVQARVPVDIGLADASQVDAIAALADDDAERAATDARIYRDRLRAGSLCFIARVGGRIVAFNWLRLHGAIGAAGVPMVLRHDEVYTTDAYTADDCRGQGIHPALNHAMLAFAQRKGHRTAYTMVRADNASSLVTMRRVGWTLSGTLLVFEPRWAQDQLRWLVLGSPYPMPVGPLASTRVVSMAELDERHAFEDRERVETLPWSYTYRLREGSTAYRLTIVPREHAGTLRTAAAVADALPEVVPRIVALNQPFESWCLTTDPGGSAPGIGESARWSTVLATYASAQARAASNSALLDRLPQADLADPVGALLDFLHLESAVDAQGDTVAGADFFVGRTEARRLHEAVERHRSWLERHLHAARRLPRTLNHGDLHPRHVRLTDPGACVLLDWTLALAGPAGLSLHGLLGDLLPTTVLLAHDGGVDAMPAPLQAYLRELVRGGYADEALLLACLPSSIAAGIVLDVLRHAAYPMEDEPLRGVAADRIVSGLERLLAVCERRDGRQDSSRPLSGRAASAGR